MSTQEGLNNIQESFSQPNVDQDIGEFSQYGQSVYYITGHMSPGDMTCNNEYGGFGFDFFQ
jgi:hypothetical protein